MLTRTILLVAAAIGTLAPIPTRAETLDQGSFQILRHDRPLGAETFTIFQRNDSLLVVARQYLTLQTSSGEQPLERAAELLVNTTDFSLRSYSSARTLEGQTIRRGLSVSDTHYVAYRETEQGGVGESRVLPPGRVYVMDSQLVTLFDLICRSLRDRAFKSRDINLLALGPRDTMLTAHAKALGNETIRWGGKSVVARKLQLVADSRTTFTLWIGPQGWLLRLSEPVGGLRAERIAPPAKTRSGSPAPTPKPGG